jgi:hypothetical protein
MASDAGPQTRLLRQLQKKLQCFASDEVFGVVKVDPDGLDGHSLAALWIVCKELSQM